MNRFYSQSGHGTGTTSTASREIQSQSLGDKIDLIHGQLQQQQSSIQYLQAQNDGALSLGE